MSLSAVIQDWQVEGKHLSLSSEAVALWPRCIKSMPVACALLILNVLEWSREISVLLENLPGQGPEQLDLTEVSSTLKEGVCVAGRRVGRGYQRSQSRLS